uniref:BT_2262 family domain-containing protein n=1 Tax=Phocaeicola sp. TaxID=2773926 RepID=UPI003AB6D5DC
RKIFYCILMGGFFMGTATSCDDSTEDLSKVTYFAELNLKGDDFVKLSVGETYTEPGYEATENGEDISERVKVSGSVNSTTPGFYNLVYSVANVDGFSVSKSRQVMVVDPDHFASAYQGESQTSTRHYTGAPILITKNSDGTYLIDDLLGGLQFYGLNPGFEPMYDFHAEAKVKLNDDNTLSLLEVGNWYFASQLTLSLTEGKYDPETGVVTMTVDYGGTPLSVTLTK